MDEEVPPLAEPEEYEDLDEEDTPLGGFDGEGEGEGNGNGSEDEPGWAETILDDIATPLAMLPTPAKAGLLAVLVALAGAGVWLIVAARKKGKKEDEQ